MNNFNSMQLTLRHELSRLLGLKGAIGAGLIALAILILLLIAPRLHKDARQTRLQTVAQLKAFNRDRLVHRSAPKSGEQLTQFNAWFPTINQNAGDLRRVLDQADQAKLVINKGDYQISSDVGMSFVKYEVVLPVKANYHTIRSFVAGVLNAVPHASLVELHMERPAANSDVLEARIHFTLFYRGA
ncbi:hypothetical protein [Paraherbaspirillum soli]|uniref:Transmembrane protein n=1 Tax=Paraherbaspirillum soli TaxID=631222 RepID=A0ABW0M9D7_9BURK